MEVVETVGELLEQRLKQGISYQDSKICLLVKVKKNQIFVNISSNIQIEAILSHHDHYAQSSNVLSAIYQFSSFIYERRLYTKTISMCKLLSISCPREDTKTPLENK